ncbi:serine hydrolase domain-containing protein [Nonomuraea aurantiaca]|uniref:serine hydrolase domain-containing protein n=1 Tax=Nonomuraea aurantiaca TaxID=2878562 RepID=UPI001CD99E0E|nr:serine hydrolase [Nonomuraea aurantiaca]MCA2230501.1 beta-lactamase family protein [Nonomuraea aurantiaca]
MTEEASAEARGRRSPDETALLVTIALAALHLIDHVLRADGGGWRLVHEAALFGLAALIPLRRLPRIRLALAALILVVLQVTHMFAETPDDQYGTWAHGVSPLLDALGTPNLLGIAQPAVGVVSVAVSMLLSAAVALTLVLFARELGRTVRAAATALLVLVLAADAVYLWAVASTNRSEVARAIAWQDSDVLDYQRLPSRTVHRRPPAVPLPRALEQELTVTASGGRRDLGDFLRSTGTTAFVAVKGDTIRAERYFNGYRHDSAVASFSTAKPFVSTLVGVALAEGRITSVDDPVTRYLPELAGRDPGFARVTLRQLLTMSSGLAQQDPYYSLDLRAAALRDSRIAEPPGRRFDYNNINTVLLGLVLERVTGGPVSAYLEDKVWGPLGMEADAAWSIDSDASGLEQMQAGLSGRAVDFAKLGLLYLHKGAWRGRQLLPRAWVEDSTRADTTTDPAAEFQYNWWMRPDLSGDYWSRGNHGQWVYVSPAHDVVLVRYGVEDGYDDWPAVLADLARRL